MQVFPSAMANHMSAIKAKLALLGLPIQMFQDPRIKYFHKAMVLCRPLKVQLIKIIDIDTLQLTVRVCDSTYMGQIFKAVYTLAFFSFLRLSNLVPDAAKLYFTIVSTSQRRHHTSSTRYPVTMVQNPSR